MTYKEYDVNKVNAGQMFSFTALLFLLLLSSCSVSDPSRVEADFGNSVRHMVEQQKAPVVNSAKSSFKPRLDGESAENSIDKYRASQKKATVRKSLDTLVP